MQTERITILASPAAKRTIAARASERGLSLGEYVRRKVLDDDELSSDEEAELAMLVEQVNLAIPKLLASFEKISESVRQLREENDAFFRERGFAA